jgi:peptide/nickel transport system ATP-binding protein
MYAGRVAETATALELFENPRHPYTKGLLESIPRLENVPKSRLNVIKGMVPELDKFPKGCRFENRCPQSMDICRLIPPPVTKAGRDHYVSCYLYGSP